MNYRKYVWDASALIAAVNTSDKHHFACHHFWKDNEEASYIFPMIAWFEFQATQSRKISREIRAVRDLYILDGNNRTVDIDRALVTAAAKNGLHQRFWPLRGADLVYATVAALEDAPLVTTDTDFMKVEGIEVIIPNEPTYGP